MDTICPKCGSKMILRSGKFGKFWACPKYPACKSTLKYNPYTEVKPIPVSITEPKIDILYSDYQLAIFDKVLNSIENILISAVAGSGKTFTLTEIFKRLSPKMKVIFLAFNKSIQLELAKKIPDCTVLTIHAFCFQVIKSIYPKIKVNANKLQKFLKFFVDNNLSAKDQIEDNKTVIIRLVNLIKESMLDCSMESLAYLIDRYSLTLNGDSQVIINAVSYLYSESIKDYTEIDFSDMIYFIANNNRFSIDHYDMILIDETQDLNPTQIRILEKMMTNGKTRLIAVGDRFQSIYGFRAASLTAMDDLKNTFKMVELNLSICYRCQQTIIDFISNNFSFKFEGKINNRLGVMDDIYYDDFYKKVDITNLVLCRNNAPLIKPAYKLLSEGKKVSIKGKEIGENLINLIQKISKKYHSDSLPQFLDDLTDYRTREVDKLNRMNQDRKIESLNDQLDCIESFSESKDSISDMIISIDSIFSDNPEEEGIIFSTIHKAKGLESNVVYLLNPGLIPSKSAKTEEEKQQEMNLKYVGFTRSKNEFYTVN